MGGTLRPPDPDTSPTRYLAGDSAPSALTVLSKDSGAHITLAVSDLVHPLAPSNRCNPEWFQNYKEWRGRRRRHQSRPPSLRPNARWLEGGRPGDRLRIVTEAMLSGDLCRIRLVGLWHAGCVAWVVIGGRRTTGRL